jgi:hypothetical protein
MRMSVDGLSSEPSLVTGGAWRDAGADAPSQSGPRRRMPEIMPRQFGGRWTTARMPTRRREDSEMMAEYTFTLIIQGDVDAHLNELFEAGCDDATFGSVDGVHHADFDRDAPTLLDAIASAIRDVESIPGLRVLHIEPDDLVTASEIAARLGRTRESIRLLIAGERGRGDFPPPVSHLRSKHRLWRWADVALWAGQSDSDMAQEARLLAATNAALELRSAVAGLPDEARAFVQQLEQAHAS